MGFGSDEDELRRKLNKLLYGTEMPDFQGEKIKMNKLIYGTECPAVFDTVIPLKWKLRKLREV